MEAKEFRIGNWVDCNGECAYVTAVGKKSVIIELGTVINDHSAYTESKNTNLDEINGVPLTDEWLTSFSFEWDIPTQKYCDGNWCVRLNHDGTMDISYIKSHYTLLPFGIGFRIRYVHQLQNLYFAITGNELERN